MVLAGWNTDKVGYKLCLVVTSGVLPVTVRNLKQSPGASSCLPPFRTVLKQVLIIHDSKTQQNQSTDSSEEQEAVSADSV